MSGRAAGALSFGQKNAKIPAEAARKDVAYQLDSAHGGEVELPVQQCGGQIDEIKDRSGAKPAEQAVLLKLRARIIPQTKQPRHTAQVAMGTADQTGS